MGDRVRIRKLLVSTRIGVPDEERATPQALCVSVEMQPSVVFEELADEIDDGVDYYQVSLKIKELAEKKPRKLIETLATDIAAMILQDFSVDAVEVDVEKYILDDAENVGVSIFRERSESHINQKLKK